MGKSSKKRSHSKAFAEDEIPEIEDKSHLPPLVRHSDEVPKRKGIWTNKQRVLVMSSRGMKMRERHIMEDIRRLLPHSKHEPKYDMKSDLNNLNEVAYSRHCNKIMYFEARKFTDLFMWLSDVDGPSIKFQMQNVHTMGELNLTGNCLKGSRPLLKFSLEFNDKTMPQLRLMKELFVQIFGTPRFHPKSQPFYDHVFVFTYLDDKIWFRNYQILQDSGELAEIGPRFVLNPVKILEDSFGGKSLYENPKYRTPNSVRAFRNMIGEDVALTKDKQRERKMQGTDKHPWKSETELKDIFGQ